jgi:putative spermidine/putrescine transport system permease protein
MGLMDRQSSIPLTFTILSCVTLFVLLAPVVIVVLSGLNSGDYLTFPPQGLSLRWVIAFLTSPIFVPAYFYSLGLSLLTALIASIIGTAASVYLSRSDSRPAGIVRGVLMLPVVMPGIVVGLALLIFYTWTGFGLARSYLGLLLGHVLVTTPFVVATVSAALAGFDRSLEDAARSLGATPWAAFRKVTLRLIAPGIAAGALFAGLLSFGQFELSLMLAVPDTNPLPLVLYTSLKYEFAPTAAAAGIFAIALVVLSTFLTSRLVNLRRVFRS